VNCVSLFLTQPDPDGVIGATDRARRADGFRIRRFKAAFLSIRGMIGRHYWRQADTDAAGAAPRNHGVHRFERKHRPSGLTFAHMFRKP